MRFRHLHLPALALIVALPAVPAAAEDDLMTILQRAQRNDPVLAQAQANFRADREALPQARAGLLPDLRATATFDRVTQEQETQFDATRNSFDDKSYGLQVTQPLFRLERFRIRDRAASEVGQSRAELNAAEQDLLVRTTERYFAVLDQRQEVEATRANRAAIERQLEQARERFEVGVIARTDVEEAKARFDLATADLLEAENELENAEEELRELTGTVNESLAVVREEAELQRPQPTSEARWRQRAEQRNWQLIAARRGAQAAMENIGVERAGHYPTIDIVGQINNVDTGGTFGGETDSYSIGVQLEMPLFQGGGTVSRVRQAQSSYTESRERLEEVRRSVIRGASDAFRAVETALQRVQALDQARISTSAALEATEAGFEVGTRTVVDVLNAQRDFFDAQRDFEQARHSYLVNIVRLQEAAGILQVSDLARINQLLRDDDS